jgi:hypothetical protein
MNGRVMAFLLGRSASFDEANMRLRLVVIQSNLGYDT